jgi:type I restriction enzyme S subunit
MKTTFPSGDTFKYIDIDAIDNKRNVVTSVKVLNTKQAPSRASRYTEKGCVLFSMVRPYLRNIAMVTEDDCIASTGFFVCQGNGCLSPKFCYYQMLSNYVVDGLNDFMKGDNSPSITKAQIEEYIFPLPPLNEQKRIVAKIQELFAVLDEIQKSIEA